MKNQHFKIVIVLLVLPYVFILCSFINGKKADEKPIPAGSEIGWCDVKEAGLVNFDNVTSNYIVNYENEFKCPDGYFIIGIKQERVSAGEGYSDIFVSKVKYAKPCIKIVTDNPE